MTIADRIRRRHPPAEPAQPEGTAPEGSLVQLARHYRDRMLREADLQRLIALPSPVLRTRIETLVSRMISEEGRLISLADRDELINYILDETVGYGPLEPLIRDSVITEIMVNGPDQVYVEKSGRLQRRPDIRFRDNEHILHIIDRIVAPLGRRIDESSPMVDARLPDGSRVNAVIAPVAIDGPVLTIRRFRKDPFTVDDLLRFQTLTPEIAAFLRAGVQAKLNFLVSGGTGSGKTTTLNVLSAFIPEHERIVTIEDAAELRLNQPHVVRLEARPPNIEGQGEITIRQLVRNALRMRPERIIVGEVRGAEALDMLQAMNTGHEGSLTTVHANSPRDAFSRLETMVLMGGVDLPIAAIREQIIGALNIVVQQNRLVDGARRIVAIAEIRGVKDGRIQLQDLFSFRQEGIAASGRVVGSFVATGIVPQCRERIKAFGVDLPEAVFDPNLSRSADTPWN